MCAERRVPHSVISAATSQDRGVNVGRQEAVQPRQQHKAEAPADIRDTCIPTPHTDHPHEGQGRQDGAKTDERRPDPGHDRASERAGRLRAASLRISRREPEEAHTSRAARTIRPVRTRQSGGRWHRQQPARRRTRARRDPATSFPPRASIVGPVRTPRPARSRGCPRRPAHQGRAARDAFPRRPSAGRPRP